MFGEGGEGEIEYLAQYVRKSEMIGCVYISTREREKERKREREKQRGRDGEE